MDSTHVDETLEGVAIIGLSGRFPGAASVDEFWRNLRAGVESIKFFSTNQQFFERRERAWASRIEQQHARHRRSTLQMRNFVTRDLRRD